MTLAKRIGGGRRLARTKKIFQRLVKKDRQIWLGLLDNQVILEASLLDQIPEPLRAKVSQAFEQTVCALNTKIRLLEEALRLERTRKYGKSSELLSDAQLQLLDAEPSVTDSEIQNEVAQREADAAAVKAEAESDTKAKVDGAKAARVPMRSALPASLPRKEIVIHCSTEACRCGQCGGEKKVIGYETSEQLSMEPVRYFVEVTKREKLACSKCEETGVTVAPVPEKIVEKGVLSNKVIVDVTIKKYCDHQPLYRQSLALKRDSGVDVSRSTLCSGVMAVGAWLLNFIPAMKQDLLANGYIQADETPVPVQSAKTQGRNHQAYLWEYSRPRGPVIYEFRMGREREGPKEFLKNYNGILQTDGYSAYDRVGGNSIMHVACWAHARRKFYEALQVDPQNRDAAAVLAKIGELYEIERQAREGGVSVEERLSLRREKSIALLGEVKDLVTKAKSNALPQSSLGRACNYVMGLWGKLERYTSDGRIEIDNNWAENAMRPVTLGRKNWLHIGSEEAGPKVAAIISIIETCKRLEIDIRQYLEDVLPKIGNWPAKRIAELPPMAWKTARRSSPA